MSEATATGNDGGSGGGEAAIDAVSALASLGIGVTDGESVSEEEGASVGGEQSDETVGGESDESAGAESAATEQSEKPGADAARKPSKREAYNALFTDEALKTPEGVKTAAEALRKSQRKHHDVYTQTVERERVAKDTIGRARAAEQNYVTLTNNFHRELEIATRHPDPAQALAALGRIRGKDGLAAYEEFTDAAIGLKKKAEQADTPAMKELRAELDGMKAQQQAQRIESENNQWRGEVAAAAAQKGAEGYAYPGIAQVVNSGVHSLREIVKAVEEDFVNSGVAPAESLAKLNKLWMHHVSKPAAAAKPVGKLPGRGVAPAREASGAGQREMTEEERMEELANDPAFKRQFGLA